MSSDETTFADPEAAAGGPEPSPAAALIVDERPIVRDAVWRLTAACGLSGPPRFAASLDGAMAGALPDAIRLAIVDLFTARYDFRALARLIAFVAPTPVVLLDDRMNAVFADHARDAGAAAYGGKDQDPDTLTALFAGVLQQEPAARAAAMPLTRRQWEVLRLIQEGLTTQEIAERLQITPGTVKLHVHRVLRATGARNRLEAALIARRFGASGRA